LIRRKKWKDPLLFLKCISSFLVFRTGFCEKIWAINEGGYFQGIYQWESKEYAEEYPGSFIFKMMTKRSAAGTLSYEIIPDTLLSNYVKKLIQ
jgi:hypothetical protein